MLINIQPFFLYPFVYPDAYHPVCDLEQQISHDCAEYDGNQGSCHLYPQLVPVTVKGSFRPFFACNETGGEDTGQDRTDDTAHSVHTESIESVIVFQLWLDDGYHVETDYRGYQSDEEGSQNTGASGSGCDGYQS